MAQGAAFGSLPADAAQNMRLDYLEEMLRDLRTKLEDSTPE